MRERRPGQIGVEQRDDAADAGDAEPDRHEFGPVRHQQADGLALAEALRERPAGVAVGALGQLAIAEALAVGQQRRGVAESLGQLLDDVGKDARRMLGDRRGRPQGAQRTLEASHVGSEPVDQSHGVSSAPSARLVRQIDCRSVQIEDIDLQLHRGRIDLVV